MGALSSREEGAAISREIGDRWTLGLSLMGVGLVVQLQGDVRRAVGLYREALVALSELGDLWTLPRTFGGLAFAAWLE